MSSRLGLTLALLGAFSLGLASYHPVAKAFEALAVTHCSSSDACIAAHNASKGAGLAGSSAKGPGVSGTSGGGDGIFGKSIAGYGVSAVSTKGTGLYASTAAGHGSTAIFSDAPDGTGVTSKANGTSPYQVAYVALAENGADFFDGLGKGGTITAEMTGDGDLILSGNVYTSGSCSGGCTRTHRVRSYGSTASLPTLEDTGEARLVRGRADVPLDPAFANAIDPQRGYVVLITPEAESNELFVMQRTARGFSVREAANGRSNAPFAYRIVAHPYGNREPRLPFVDAGRR